jgi:hypothetical protein
MVHKSTCATFANRRMKKNIILHVSDKEADEVDMFWGRLESLNASVGRKGTLGSSQLIERSVRRTCRDRAVCIAAVWIVVPAGCAETTIRYKPRALG